MEEFLAEKQNKILIFVECVEYCGACLINKGCVTRHDKCFDSNLRPLVMVSMSSLASSSTLLASSNTTSICDDLEDLNDDDDDDEEIIETPKEDSPEPETSSISIYGSPLSSVYETPISSPNYATPRTSVSPWSSPQSSIKSNGHASAALLQTQPAPQRGDVIQPNFG